MLKIEHSQTFAQNGKPFFWLADTCWSAFTNITDSEWDYYLHYRKEQGFNTLQINILPQWDASQTDLHHDPFGKNEDGTWNYEDLKPAYFQHARSMCQKAQEYGFELALVVLWCNYVPDTWASRFYNGGILPMEAMDAYLEIVNKSFSDLNPVYVISGDTDFDTKQAETWYIHASNYLKGHAPEILQTTHIKGRYTYIPKELEENLDFLMYQSGHNAKDLDMPWKQALEMQEKYPGKPLINAEPCYEEMGYSGQMYGRWSQQDIRAAAWQSILAGACAGITYGAAGIYSWHQSWSFFDAARGEGFAKPKPWQDALHFEGAWDYARIAWLIDNYKLNGIASCQEVLSKPNDKIRIGRCKQDLILYSPVNIPFFLQEQAEDYEAIAFDLDNGHILHPTLVNTEKGMLVDVLRVHHDVLIVLKHY